VDSWWLCCVDIFFVISGYLISSIIFRSIPPQECDALKLFVSKEISELKPKIVLLAQRDAWNPQIADYLYVKLMNMGVQKVLF
jgi:hypothetical protein